MGILQASLGPVDRVALDYDKEAAMNKKQFVKIKTRCAEIPGEEGWCKFDGQRTFVKAAVKMVDRGFAVDDALELLSDLYQAVTSELLPKQSAEMSVQGIVWRKDNCGDYWTADLFRDGKRIGVTGNYYDVGRSGQRPVREDTIISFRVNEDNSKLDKRQGNVLDNPWYATEMHKEAGGTND